MQAACAGFYGLFAAWQRKGHVVSGVHTYSCKAAAGCPQGSARPAPTTSTGPHAGIDTYRAFLVTCLVHAFDMMHDVKCVQCMLILPPSYQGMIAW